MASFVLFTFTTFLLFVARSANATQCYECFEGQSFTCTGASTLKNCTNEEKCVSVSSVANLSMAHSRMESFARSCEASAYHLTGSFHFNFGDRHTLEITSEVCNETKPQCQRFPEGDSMRIYENGKSCPKCFRTGHDNCESDGDELCLGNLVNCTEVNGEITSKYSGMTIPFAGKGCGTPSVCGLKGKSFRQGPYTFTFKDVQCSNALSSLRRLAFTLEKKDLGPQVAFFFPCILGIFAVKILS